MATDEYAALIEAPRSTPGGGKRFATSTEIVGNEAPAATIIEALRAPGS